MKSDHELMEVIREAGFKANNHHCHCPYTPYAVGSVPSGYYERAKRFAANLGFRMRQSMQPRQFGGPGCDGYTTGWQEPCPGCGTYHGANPFEIVTVPQMPSAHGFIVTAHEMAHAFLGHPARNRHEAEEIIALKKRMPNNENFGYETAAHLAAIGAAATADVRVAQMSTCYLAQRVMDHKRNITEQEEYAAFLAAREIGKALA